MEKDYLRIAELISRKLRGQDRSEDQFELNCLVEKYPELKSLLDDPVVTLSAVKERLKLYEDLNIENEWQLVLDKYTSPSRPSRPHSRWWAVAASIVALCLIASAVLWYDSSNTTSSETLAPRQITPGQPSALLTLSDGSTIKLGSDGARIIEDGIIQFSATGSTLDYSTALETEEVHMHNLRVPLGGTFHIQLADGTDVWLNADSELTFPSAFVQNERIVKVRGEAYFEVAKDLERPFIVEVDDTQVEALGTSFNINTHLHSGRTKTILIEGLIKVSSQGISKIVQPGFGSLSGAGHIHIERSDTDEALAWKDGYFYFDSKSLKEVLEEIARWYNVEVDMREADTNKKYRGGIKKTESIQVVCAVLSDLTGYGVSMKNNTLIVKP